jgi:hypothetical protein
VNFVGHLATAVASSHQDAGEAGFRVGVMAPDLASGAGVSLRAPTAAVAAGLAEHHRADAAFHSLAWFRSTTQQLSVDLQGAGVRRGPARAVAHVGVELLMDGELLRDPAIARSFDEAWAVLGAGGPEVAGLVVPEDQRSWLLWLERFTTYVDPRRYADPVSVALATERILARRPRLAFDAGERAAVEAVLVAAAEPVRAGAANAVALAAA